MAALDNLQRTLQEALRKMENARDMRNRYQQRIMRNNAAKQRTAAATLALFDIWTDHVAAASREYCAALDARDQHLAKLAGL